MENLTENNLLKKENCKKAEFYIKKYLGEIRLHFDLNSNDIKKILIRIVRKKDTSKKWWKFFIKNL